MSKKLIIRHIAVLIVVSALVLVGFIGTGLSNKDDSVDEIILAEDTLDYPLIIPAGEVIKNEDSDCLDTKKFDATIERFMRKWEIKGASFALMKDGKLIYAKGYGYADEENDIKTEVKHIFRIASLSKLITATGIMKLVEDGKLSLDDRVFGEEGILNDSIFLTYRDSRIPHITIEHLLRHQGGFSTRLGDPMFYPLTVAQKMDAPAPADLNTMIRFVLSRRLGYTPGSASSYSNIGYGILSRIIEKVSGMAYESYIQKNILLPAGCFDMYIGHNFYEDRYANEVRYYQAASEEIMPCCDGSGKLVPKYYGGNNVEGLSGAGGWLASPVELLRFLAVIDGDETIPDILSPETIKLMTTYHKGSHPIGWMYVSGGGNWVRTGTLSGTSALMKKQQNGYSWVFLTNTSAWKGAKFPKYIDRHVSQAMHRVKQWPENDLFELQNNHSPERYLVHY
ncbi:beta-lactamase family protein [Odoribacter sp. OttesenSCG-928-J03]|nr:beta-lactamase family protein [Odoribacter sp. OttesenSCG-928-J03]MDL2331192.1 beta-lactamase family protein [Odoribacter sp. OttesenSCG-928-A06]